MNTLKLRKKLEKAGVFKQMQTEKGVAGLNVFLGVIVSLFMIGLIVMVFVIAGGRLENVARTDLADNTSANVINQTKIALSGATDWFDIFIVLAALVVLVLLVVVIVSAIGGAGLTGGGGA